MSESKVQYLDMGCGFCSGKITIGYTTEVLFVTHTLPTCDTFDEMDVPEFITANRKKLGLPDPAEN